MSESKDKIQDVLKKIQLAKVSNDWSDINSELISRRLNWYRNRKNGLLFGTDVKKAYSLLILEYLKIAPIEAPIIFENDSKIIWRSYNWCPVLEACKIGGFDTREICKKGWESSAQLLIQQINSKLCFTRNYCAIRPYTPYCEEIIELSE
ncbi:MAG: hypothetical protein ACFFB2_09965 [Promethearchaeota archaeon]